MYKESIEYPGFLQMLRHFRAGKSTSYANKVYEFWRDSFAKASRLDHFNYKFDSQNSLTITLKCKGGAPSPFVIKSDWPFSHIVVYYQIIFEPTNCCNHTCETYPLGGDRLSRIRSKIFELGELSDAEAARDEMLDCADEREQLRIGERLNGILRDVAKMRGRKPASKKVEAPKRASSKKIEAPKRARKAVR